MPAEIHSAVLPKIFFIIFMLDASNKDLIIPDSNPFIVYKPPDLSAYSLSKSVLFVEENYSEIIGSKIR